jgi:hypothetical protein
MHKTRWLYRVIFGVRAGRKVKEFARGNVIACSIEHAMALGVQGLELEPHPSIVANVEQLVRITSSPATLRRKKARLLRRRKQVHAARSNRRRLFAA